MNGLPNIPIDLNVPAFGLAFLALVAACVWIGYVLGHTRSGIGTGGRKEKEVRQQLLSAIVDSSDDAIISKSLDGTITTWNKGAEKIFGYKADEIVGRPVLTLIPPDKQKEEPAILERLRRGEPIDHYETVRVRKDGRPIDVSLSISPIRDAHGRIVGAAKIARDITEHKLADRRFKEEKEKLERVNLELDRFVYIASHDLRSPLRAISSFATFVREDFAEKLDERGLDYLLEITKAANKMSKLIDDLLTLSRVSRINSPHESVRISEAVNAAVDRLSVEIARYQAKVVVDADMPELWCDRFKMTEVFANLISNAVKFSRQNPSRPYVTVGHEERAGHYEFFVKDNGIGIDPRYHGQIFQMFRRLHTDKEFEGTGLGLYIVRRIIEEANGRIWVESSPMNGAAFHFTWPKTVPQSQRESERSDNFLEGTYA